MPAKRKITAILMLGCLALITSCTDATNLTAPQVNEPSQGLLGGTLGLLGLGPVHVLHRTTTLAQDEVVTKVISPWGGVIRLPEAGLTVYFPRGAVDHPTSITVDAPAGDLVGYYFGPEGLHFRRALTAVQDLSNTDAGLLQRILGTSLEAAYFKGTLKPTVDALEILNLNLLGLLHRADFHIQHFSGYVIATN
jgi:hypothetical protein